MTLSKEDAEFYGTTALNSFLDGIVQSIQEQGDEMPLAQKIAQAEEIAKEIAKTVKAAKSGKLGKLQAEEMSRKFEDDDRFSPPFGDERVRYIWQHSSMVERDTKLAGLKFEGRRKLVSQLKKESPIERTQTGRLSALPPGI